MCMISMSSSLVSIIFIAWGPGIGIGATLASWWKSNQCVCAHTYVHA